MSENRQAEAFDRQVATFLPLTSEEQRLPAEFHEAVAMARHLAQLDLVDESRIQDELGERLARAAAGQGRRSGGSAGRPSWVLRPALVGALVVAFLAGTLAMLSPATLAALGRILERIRVGDNTSVVRHAPVSESEVAEIVRSHRERLEAGATWYLDTPYGGFGDDVAPGEEPVIRQVSSLRIADAMTSYRLLSPTHFPAQVPPDFRFRFAQIAPGGWTFLFFNIGRFETMLAQVPVGSGRSVTSSFVVSRVGPDGETSIEGVEIRAETLRLGGQELLWRLNPDSEDVGMLMWEAGGVSYTLAGQTLTRDEAVEIYESLEPIK